MSEAAVFIRAVRLGRWLMVRRMIAKWSYGLTHVVCRQCNGRKVRNLHSNCPRCQYNNLMKIFNDDLWDNGHDVEETDAR